jgi:glucosamine-6-phosphate deaminase
VILPKNLPDTTTAPVKKRVFPSKSLAVKTIAREMADLILARQKEKRHAVLGLATGSTPIPLYAELVRLHREENLSFGNVVTFNLDEYFPMRPDNPRSYHHFMRAHLFDLVDIPAPNIHLLDGTIPETSWEEHCDDYEREIKKTGGIDFQILGIGRTGHIGFNEPGSSNFSRTRFVELDELTRQDAAKDFGGLEHTPRFALSMGVSTILKAKCIVIMAWGEGKAEIVNTALHGEISEEVPATFLRTHGNVQFVVDEAAAGVFKTAGVC